MCKNTIWIFWFHPRVKTPSPGDITFTSLVKGFLICIMMNSVNLTDIWEWRTILFNIICIVTTGVWPFWSRVRTKLPSPENMKFTILVEGFQVFINMNLFFLNDVRKKIFKNSQALTCFVLSQGPVWDKSHEIYNLCFSYPKMNHT